jgi:hypothetical protein
MTVLTYRTHPSNHLFSRQQQHSLQISLQVKNTTGIPREYWILSNSEEQQILFGKTCISEQFLNYGGLLPEVEVSKKGASNILGVIAVVTGGSHFGIKG